MAYSLVNTAVAGWIRNGWRHSSGGQKPVAPLPVVTIRECVRCRGRMQLAGHSLAAMLLIQPRVRRRGGMETVWSEPPAVARLRVRRALREAREASGLRQTHVADRLSWSVSKLRRIEGGEVGVSITDLRALLDLYDVRDPVFIEQLTSSAAASRRQRWSVPAQFRARLTPALVELLQFEQEATAVRAYQPFAFPDVLQTQAMAEHLLGTIDESLSEQDRQVRLDVRMMRARHLTEQADAPAYSVMLDESVLKRMVGGRAVLADQLEAIVSAAERPHIRLRIVPMSEGAKVGMLGAFTVLDLSDDGIGAVLYRESGTTDRIVQDPETVSSYRNRFDNAWPRCYSEDDSLCLVRTEAMALRASLIRRP
ncbi:helix-turn-helix transcriptional regulator [Actinoplanes sp. NPDC048791]|uniref:helix-turn-helix domain-containing protein n=1 Tax=Actinoplanes sp. NPDC048791 TaxID=3154623 RepID=UPI0033F6224E